MTYYLGHPVKPVVGEFFTLRAGLQVFIFGHIILAGVPYWEGLIVGEASGKFLWYEGGNYCPTHHANEMDIMFISC